MVSTQQQRQHKAREENAGGGSDWLGSAKVDRHSAKSARGVGGEVGGGGREGEVQLTTSQSPSSIYNNFPSSSQSQTRTVSEAVSPQLASPPGMAPVGEDEPSQDCLESPQHNTTLVNMEASLETQQESDVSPPQHAENTAVSQTPDKCVQCEQLSEELRASRAKCSDLQCLQQRMENQVNELQTQVDNLQTQETYLKNEIVSLEKKLKETVSAGDRLTTGVHALLKETDVTAVPKVTVTPERSPALQPTSVILQPDTDSLPPPQQVLDHYQSKLEILEKENQTL
ncbi:hypothetical protein Hamer_G017567, partial [Homarus americanus]